MAERVQETISNTPTVADATFYLPIQMFCTFSTSSLWDVTYWRNIISSFTFLRKVKRLMYIDILAVKANERASDYSKWINTSNEDYTRIVWLLWTNNMLRKIYVYTRSIPKITELLKNKKAEKSFRRKSFILFNYYRDVARLFVVSLWVS